MSLKALYSTVLHSPSHTHIHTVHLLAALCRSMRGNSGFSILPKDTSACRWGRLGIELPTFRLEAAALPLSHSQVDVSWTESPAWVFECRHNQFSKCWCYWVLYNMLRAMRWWWWFLLHNLQVYHSLQQCIYRWFARIAILSHVSVTCHTGLRLFCRVWLNSGPWIGFSLFGARCWAAQNDGSNMS